MNDKCFCCSTKKYKKCCLNKSSNYNNQVIQEDSYLPSKNINELITRNTLNDLMKNINKEHCEICGDTNDDEKILKITTQKKDTFLCETCYNIEINM